MKRSFSQGVKDELLTLLQSSTSEPHEDDRPSLAQEERNATFLFILISQATFLGGRLRYQSTSAKQVELMAAWLEERFETEPIKVKAKGQRAYLLLDHPASYEKLVQYLREQVSFDTTLGRVSLQLSEISLGQRRALLRALLLAQGSIADPSRSYQLELVIRRRTLAALAEEVMRGEGLEPQRVERDLRVYLYLKNGDQIMRYLGLVGAHQAVLSFENYRIERELRGQVNRQVNFDSANLQKIADAAAKQLDDIARIQEAGLFDKLPEDLAAIARARVANPSYSLAELGETLDPPIGKSGTRHRLRRLSQFVEEHLD